MSENNEISRILIVDDDEDILTIARITLEMNLSLKVRTLSHSMDTLPEALNFKPDIILLDMMMPKQNGVSTLKLLRQDKKLAHIPVIFFTAKALSNDVEYFKELGAQGIIIKPFDPLKLSMLIQEVWENYKI